MLIPASSMPGRDHHYDSNAAVELRHAYSAFPSISIRHLPTGSEGSDYIVDVHIEELMCFLQGMNDCHDDDTVD
jgi:hypothetical protein